MPIYGYACKKCDHTLDALQKISDDPLVDCPACGEPALKRQLSAPRFRLKGQGWYETDFKDKAKSNVHTGDDDKGSASSSNNEKSAKESSSAPSDSSSKNAGSTDSKPKKSSSSDD